MPAIRKAKRGKGKHSTPSKDGHRPPSLATPLQGTTKASDKKNKQLLKHYLETECDFRRLFSAEREEIEAACNYEYMRESQALRDAFAVGIPGKGEAPTNYPLPLFCSQLFTAGEVYELLIALLVEVRFPNPWNSLEPGGRARLIKVLTGPEFARKRGYSPFVIEEAFVDHDYERELERGDDRDYSSDIMWRLTPSEPKLLREWEKSGRNYSFGFVRIDPDCTESQAVEAIKAWFKKPTIARGGGDPSSKWAARLKTLAAMRIAKVAREKWQRLRLTAEFCGYAGCVKEATAYQARCKQGDGDAPMDGKAKVEMSSARKESRDYFQKLFPGEIPASW